MPTRFYLRGSTHLGFPTTGGPFSSVLPVGTDATSSFSGYPRLADQKGNSLATSGETSLAQTAHQDGCMGLFASAPLKAQSIGSGTWDLGLAVDTTNAAANAFLALSIYIWRPSTASVVGYIYDSDTALGNEFATSPTGQLYSVSGSEITVANNDRLVVECWFHAEQDDAVSRTNLVQFSGATDVFAGSTGFSQASWVDPPAAVDLYEGVYVSSFISGTTSAATLSLGGPAAPPNKLEDLALLVVVGKGAATNIGINASSGTTGWTELEKGTLGSYCYGLWWLEVSSDDINTSQALDTTIIDTGTQPTVAGLILCRNNVVSDPFISWDAQANNHASGTSIAIPSPIGLNATAEDAHTDCFGAGFDVDSELAGTHLHLAIAAYGATTATGPITPPTGYLEITDLGISNEQTLEASYKLFLPVIAGVEGWGITLV